MTEKELILFKKTLEYSRSYLEFGSGNSTIIAAEQDRIERITVVESDTTFWNEQISVIPVVKSAIYAGRLRLLLIDIGPIGKWGYPLDDSYRERWPEYSSLAFQKKEQYDLVLVDGRFRVASVLQVCLHCSLETKIVIHDFFNRPQYFVILPFLKLEDYADTLGVFTINKEYMNGIVESYISIYEYLPGM